MTLKYAQFMFYIIGSQSFNTSSETVAIYMLVSLEIVAIGSIIFIFVWVFHVKSAFGPKIFIFV